MRQILFPLSAQHSLAWKFWAEGGRGGGWAVLKSKQLVQDQARGQCWCEAGVKLAKNFIKQDFHLTCSVPVDVVDALSTLWGCVAHGLCGVLFCVMLCLEPVSCTLCSCFVRFHLCCVLFCVMFCARCSEPGVSCTTALWAVEGEAAISVTVSGR